MGLFAKLTATPRRYCMYGGATLVLLAAALVQAGPTVPVLAHSVTPSNGQAISVFVAIQPAYAAISNAVVFFTSNNWITSSSAPALWQSGIVYRATLPALPADTVVRYSAMAADMLGAHAWGVTNTYTVFDGAFANAVTCRIMAANITSGNYQSYEDAGIRIFQGLKPDIVGIQEFSYRSGSLRQLVNTAFGTGFYYYVEPGGQSIPNGVVSRWPIIASGEWDDPYVPDRDFAWATIDVPGPRNLHVVSVHLWSSGGASGRNNEAIVLTNRMRSTFPAGDFIVLAGDLNTDSRTEAALSTLKTFLRDARVPVDKNNNDKTNEPRSKPYDYVLPNAVLDSNHAAVVIDGRAYNNGLVFDSAVWHDATLPAPILPGDSHVSGMQHMPVVKDFLLPGDAADRAPYLAPLAHHDINIDQPLTFSVIATDADNDLVSLTCSDSAHFSATAGAGSATGTYSWTPAAADAGEHAVLFTASAANKSASQMIAITVIPEPLCGALCALFLLLRIRT